jgi:hypothetical protein
MLRQCRNPLASVHTWFLVLAVSGCRQHYFGHPGERARAAIFASSAGCLSKSHASSRLLSVRSLKGALASNAPDLAVRMRLPMRRAGFKLRTLTAKTPTRTHYDVQTALDASAVARCAVILVTRRRPAPRPAMAHTTSTARVLCMSKV